MFPPRPDKPAYLNRTQAWTRAADGTPFAGKSGENFGDTSATHRQSFAGFVRQMNECVPAIDEGVGKLVAALRETGQLANTLIIYTADQGFGMGEHGFRTKLGPYDATYRSPLIISLPGVTPPGSVCSLPVNAPDLVSTMIAQAGVTLPWNTHGHDLTPVLRAPTADWQAPCLYEFTGEIFGSRVAELANAQPEKAEYHAVPWYTAVVHRGWKLIRYLKPGVGEELYDLQNDPEELHNLANKPESGGRLGQLRVTLDSELKRTKAGFDPQAGTVPR
jgi:arylsulfatase A-like enzyme